MDEKKIKLNDKIEVYGTGKVATMPEGAEVKVHPELAKKLIAAGKATKSKPKDKQG
jgi:hypothetical protein